MEMKLRRRFLTLLSLVGMVLVVSLVAASPVSAEASQSGSADPVLSSTSIGLNIYNCYKDDEGYYYTDNNQLVLENISYENDIEIESSSTNLEVEQSYFYMSSDGEMTLYLYPKKTGTYTVTVTVDDQKLTCKVKVYKLYFSRHSKTASDGNSSTWVEGYSMLALYKGETATLKVKGVPSDGTVKWSSSNTSVAKVSSNGKVTAKARGSATITAEYDGVSITYDVGVSYKNAIKALRYCTKHYSSKYSQAKRMQSGYYDCSSFVWRAYKSAGVYVGSSKSYAPTAADMAKWCVDNHYMMFYKTAKISKLLPGDLVFWCDSSESNGRYKGIYHVDMYQGNGALISVEDGAGQKFYYNDGTLYNVMVARPCGLKTSGLKATTSGSSVTLTWNKVYGASKYQVYRSTSKSGTYKKVATVSGKTWTDTSTKSNKTYYYKVRAKFSSGKTYYGKFSSKVNVTTKKSSKLPATTLKLKSNSGGKIKLSWSKVSGASGYVIYRSTSKDGTYKKYKTITSGSTTSYTKSGLTSGKTYYYKIKAYKKSGSSKKMGKASNVLKVKVK